MIDIGKGFGKYGLLIHEYCGLDHSHSLDPQVDLKKQSRVTVDCVEINQDYDFPHIAGLYNQTILGDIMAVYSTLEH